MYFFSLLTQVVLNNLSDDLPIQWNNTEKKVRRLKYVKEKQVKYSRGNPKFRKIQWRRLLKEMKGLSGLYFFHVATPKAIMVGILTSSSS